MPDYSWLDWDPRDWATDAPETPTVPTTPIPDVNPFTISKIIIGGRESTAVDGFWHEEFSWRQNLSDRPSELALTVIPKDQSDTAWLTTTADVEVFDQDDLRVFGGYLMEVEDELIRTGELWHPIRAVDWSRRLHSVQNLTKRTYENRTDRDILKMLFEAHADVLDGLDVQDTFVQIVGGNVGEFVVENVSLHEAVRRLAELVNAEYYVDAYKHLRWFKPVTIIAPLALSTDISKPNLINQSEQLDGDEWTATGVTITADVLQRPAVTGFNAADRLYADGGSGPFLVERTVDIPEAGAVTVSAYLLNEVGSAYNGTDISYLELVDADGVTFSSWFDHADELAQASTGVTARLIDVSADAGGQPWYRCVIECANVAEGDATLRIGFGKQVGQTYSRTFSSATSENLIATAVQVVQGAGATPYRRVDSADKTAVFGVRSWEIDHGEIATRVTVLAGTPEGDDAEQVVVTVDDETAQAEYGVWHSVITDRSLVDTTAVTLLAQSELARKARPDITAEIATRGGGLRPGMEVQVNAPERRVRWQNMQVQSVLCRFDGRDAYYGVRLGPPIRDLVRLQQLLRYQLITQQLGNVVVSGGGEAGADGSSVVPIYIRSSTEPTLPDPPGSVAADGTYSPPAGWSLTEPAGTDPIWTAFITITP